MRELAFLMGIIISIPISFAQAAPLNLLEFTREALQHDVDYQSAWTDKQMADVKWQAADNLYRNQFSVSPYLRSYRIREIDGASAYNYDETGITPGFTQYLPTGTKLTFSADHRFENSRTTSTKKGDSFLLSVSQPLWRNQFGLGDRQARLAVRQQALAQNINATRALRDSCLKNSGTFLEAWTTSTLANFVEEVATVSEELFRRGEKSYQKGQIGQLDWLGVKSDYYNLQNRREQNRLDVLKLRTQLEIVAPSAKAKTLVDPSGIFQSLVGQIPAEPGSRPWLEEEYYQILKESYELQTTSDRSFSRPDLDLLISQSLGAGKVSSESYRDGELQIGLNFIWPLYDPARTSKERLSRLEAERNAFRAQEAARTRRGQYFTSMAEVKSLAEQISIETKRTQVLNEITSEHKRRFLQGRIEFQAYLLVKEQWFQSQTKLLENQLRHWRQLTSFSLQENLPVPFCEVK